MDNKIQLKKYLEKLYKKYNKREFVSPDPLQFLYEYKEEYDIEIIALISSSLAYGNVTTILKSIRKITNTLVNPYIYILSAPERKIINDFKNFKHRFTTGKEVSNILISLKKIYENYDSLFNLFYELYKKTDSDVVETLKLFSKFFSESPTLIPDVSKGSACKRLFLFLRWLIRKDNVDIGIWSEIPASSLIIPLDTHMLNISKMIGFTKNKNGNMKTAKEITNHFKIIAPEDPVKYDFVLTRFGIRKELSIDKLSYLA